MNQCELAQIRLVSCAGTRLEFGDTTFELTGQPDGCIKVALDDLNYALVRRQPHHVPYEAEIFDGVIVDETRHGTIDFGRYFLLDWDDDAWLPQVTFKLAPDRVERRYARGQTIELGLELVARYRVAYDDGVEATFRRVGQDRFEFGFSTGFFGWFWKDPDGSYTLKFHGDRLSSIEDARRSQSKFIVSRCKYSGNLLLILQEDARVTVE